ncbi:MAG: aminotransferase class I/II-fold pyridoxal phosphate-dependent enzyme [Clostridia bacterium]|nr:aminotransferase class I/II-fold pyridoxal phosphate-dependent enzyme [Clostridia bacterium]
MNYDKYLSRTARAIPPSGIRKFFSVVEDIPDAISLGVGEPDFVTPWQIRDAAIKSLQKGYTAYTSNNGLKRLREEIAAYECDRFNACYEPDEVVVTIGASEAIDIALRALINAGDEVIIPDPSFVSYAPLVSLAGGVPVPLPCKADNGFKPTAQALEGAITPRTKAVILPFPNNPTGTVLDGSELQSLCAPIIKHDLFAISDEIYAELTYGARHVSTAAVAGMRERTVLVSGFSKAFAMTGWRIGYLCAPKPVVSVLVKIHQYAIMCAPTAGQYAALAALTYGKQDGFAAVAEMREKYDMRRRFVVSECNAMGLTCPAPSGAFYVFPDVSVTGMTGEEFAENLLKEHHVAVVPGNAFGLAGQYHVRCSYATGMAQLTEALKRIGEFTAAHK